MTATEVKIYSLIFINLIYAVSLARDLFWVSQLGQKKNVYKV